MSEAYVTAIKTAVVPVVIAFQTALNKGLLLPSERQNMYFAFDMSEMLKGDILKRYQAYQVGLSNNFLQPDEVRYKEDLAPLGFNFVRLGLDSVLLDTKTDTIYTPNTNQTAKFGINKSSLTLNESNEQRSYIQDPETGQMQGSTGGGSTDSGKSKETTSQSIANPAESGIIKTEDISIGRSVGAKAKNYDVLDPETGEFFNFFEGTKIQNVQVFAGNGCKKQLNEEVANGLAEQIGGNASDWQHAKGIGVLNVYGEDRKAEVHWFQEKTVGKHKFKVKRWLDDEG